MISRFLWFVFMLLLVETVVQAKIKTNPITRYPRDVSFPEKFVQIQGREYLFSVQTTYTWNVSQSRCEEIGMTLVNLETTQEHDAIFDYILNSGEVEDIWRWTGGHRVNNEWFWSNGAAFTDLNWAPGQPSNPPEVPNDATNFLVAIGGWDDDNGEEWQMSYICEQID